LKIQTAKKYSGMLTKNYGSEIRHKTKVIPACIEVQRKDMRVAYTLMVPAMEVT